MNDALTAKTSRKKVYTVPQLMVYGSMLKLTAAGSGFSKEGALNICNQPNRPSWCVNINKP